MATVVGLLVNPTNPNLAEPTTKNLRAAAHTLGLQLHILNASTDRDFDTVFATLIQLQLGALVIGADPFFSSRLEQLAALTVHHAVPTVYQSREFTAAGGLMSYGASFTDTLQTERIYNRLIIRENIRFGADTPSATFRSYGTIKLAAQLFPIVGGVPLPN